MPDHTLKISELPPVLRPREKLIQRGARSLSDTELLAILLGSGIRGRNVLGVANRLLRLSSKKGLQSLQFRDFMEERGVGEAKGCTILAAIELGRRLFSKENDHLPKVESPQIAFELTRDLAEHKKEYFVSLYLNAKNQVLKRETISIGSLFSNMVHPREVFAPALEVSAAAIVLAHNHPSGDPEPSPEDRRLTERLVEAGKLMGVEVLDHLVIARKGFVSFQERGFL